MKNTSEAMANLGVVPRLRLAKKDEKGTPRSTGPHRVKIIRDEIKEEFNQETKKPEDMITYYFEENGQERMYKVPVLNKAGEPHYLAQRLSECEEGDEIILEMQNKNGRSFISVTKVTPEGESVNLDEDEGDEGSTEEGNSSDEEELAPPF